MTAGAVQQQNQQESAKHGTKRRTSKGKENRQENIETPTSKHPENECSNEDDQSNAITGTQECAECRLPLARSSHIINIGDHTSRWHAECFRCSICHEPLDRKQSCHVYQNKIICRNDYLRLKRDNAVHCARCRWPISASDWVRKAASHVYHIACFNCDICSRQLNTGEQFIINTQRLETVPVSATAQRSSPGAERVRLLCRLHFNVTSALDGLESGEHDHNGRSNGRSTSVERSDSPERNPIGQPNDCRRHLNAIAESTNDTSPERSTSASSPGAEDSRGNPSESVTMTQQQQQLTAAGPSTSSATIDFAMLDQNQRLSIVTTSSSSQLNHLASSSSSTTSNSSLQTSYMGPMTPINSGSQTSSGLPCKSKRVRTTFTEDQLSILQTHFQIDSNPDGQDLERIATITGLSKRVTQVWFQNSRARQKKYMIKRKPLSGAAASLALAASFNLTNMVGSPLDQHQSGGFGMAQFSDENAFSATANAEQIDCAKVDVSGGWQSHEQRLTSASRGREDGRERRDKCYTASRSESANSSNSSEDGDRLSMVMDEDSRETTD